MNKTYEVLAIKICYHWVNFTQIYDVYYGGKVENGIYRLNKSIICKLDNHNNKYIYACILYLNSKHLAEAALCVYVL